MKLGGGRERERERDENRLSTTQQDDLPEVVAADDASGDFEWAGGCHPHSKFHLRCQRKLLLSFSFSISFHLLSYLIPFYLIVLLCLVATSWNSIRNV